MRNAIVFIIALLTVSLVLLAGEISQHKDHFPDYQGYGTKRAELLKEVLQ